MSQDRIRKETPERMVSGGRVAGFGVFREPFREINLLDLDLSIKGLGTSRFARDTRLKEWQHFGIVQDQYYLGMVIFDAKYMSTSFFYAFNRDNGEFFEHSRTTLAGPIRVARELWHGDCYFRHAGYFMEFENRLDIGMHRIKVEIRGSRGKPPVSADIRVLEDLDRIEPLVAVMPVDVNRPMYTHKAACPVEGKVKIGDVEIEMDPGSTIGLMDVQKTFYPYKTFWKWATFGGYDAGGKIVAMNACRNFIENDERYNENCSWVDGKINLLSAARFEFNEKDVFDTWRIKTTGGDLGAEFKPRGERHGKIDLGVVVSDFHQPFGIFEGKMNGPGGLNVDINDFFGVCEFHRARF